MIQAIPPGTAQRTRIVALAGNPNTGKTTIFNRLTGANQKVANYPGVTVESHEGRLRLQDGSHVRAVDVPGAYSLSARSEDERIALAAVAGLPPYERPDLVVVVTDATRIERSLYLVLQVIETGVPVVVALNMVDQLEAHGLTADVEALQRELGVPVVPTSALHRRGMIELVHAIGNVLDDPSRGSPGWRWRPGHEALRADMEAVSAFLPPAWLGDSLGDRRACLALWALLSLDSDDELVGVPAELREAVAARRTLAQQAGREIEAEVIGGRWNWIEERKAIFVRARGAAKKTASERIDAVLLHPAVGFALFLVFMGALFQALFTWSEPAIAAIESAVNLLARGVDGALPAGIVRDFLVEGLLAGVGSVVVFLPQILLLFLFIGVMEDTGYMARVAFLMDRLMKAVGLHGRAFVPMLSGFACAIPAVLATRTMERRRDRLLTMMVVPLMTCSARLPIYTLVIGALFPPSEIFGWVPVQGLLMVGMYLFSTVMALVCTAVLGRTLFKGPRVPLILELPPYRRPHVGSVLRLMIEKSRLFFSEAGRVIVVCTIVLWFLLAFPRVAPPSGSAGETRSNAEAVDPPSAESLASAEQRASEQLRSSYGGRIGRALEPAIAPLGFDWKIGIGLVGAFAAREVFVSTMGVVYGVGEGAGEESVSLRESIRDETRADGQPVYTPLVGLSLMVFFALACQCMSTLAVVRRETHTWRWPLFLFAYMTALAWAASFVIFQGGRLLGFD